MDIEIVDIDNVGKLLLISSNINFSGKCNICHLLKLISKFSENLTVKK